MGNYDTKSFIRVSKVEGEGVSLPLHIHVSAWPLKTSCIMREGVVFDEVSVYFLQSSFMRQAIRRLLSTELVFNYLPFQLVSLNPGFPENL